MFWSIFVVIFLQCLFFGTAQEVCSTQMERLRLDRVQSNIFVGCDVRNGSYNNATIMQFLDSFYCGPADEFDNSTSITVALSAENRLFRWSRVCLILQNQTEVFLLYTLTVDAAQSTGYKVYIERNLLSNLRIKRTPIYKVFPHINLRLPADFFYPFSCKGCSNSLNLLMLFILLLISIN